MAKLIGTDPNQVPSNADLGTMAYQDKDNVHLTGRVVVSAVNPAPFTVPNASESLEINDGSTTKLLMYADNSNAYIQASKYNGTNPGRTLIFATKQGTDGIAGESARFNVNGNLAFPNGQGIDFSASAGSGQTSSLLDDYEEGSWTPTLSHSSGGSTATYSVQSGRYVKVGSLVFCMFRVAISAKGSGTGSIRLSGLPFNTSGFGGDFAGGNCDLFYSNGATNWVNLKAGARASNPQLYIYGQIAATNRTIREGNFDDTDINSNFDLRGSFSYRIN
jgi:hypothetical protein